MLQRMRSGLDTYLSSRILRRAQRCPRPLAIVYGNCQAHPIRRILASSAAFTDRYQLVEVPPVHLLSRRQALLVRDLMPHVGLFLTQEVRDNYRGLPLGSRQMISLMSGLGKVLKFPVAYYEGLHPFLVYINMGGELSEPAPLTGYHDLRILAAARQGMTVERALTMLHGHTTFEEPLQELAKASVAALAEREATLDISIADRIEHCGLSFFTVNHPCTALLAEVAKQAVHALDLPSAVTTPTVEPLASTAAPVPADVLRALRISAPPIDEWTIDWRITSLRTIVQAHLDWYGSRPDVMETGFQRHADRMEAFGLI